MASLVCGTAAAAGPIRQRPSGKMGGRDTRSTDAEATVPKGQLATLMRILEASDERRRQPPRGATTERDAAQVRVTRGQTDETEPALAPPPKRSLWCGRL